MAPPLRIVVVDDTPSVRVSIRYIVENSGFGQLVGSYGFAREALEAISIHPPDLVLMDIRLPDGCGIECTRALKSRHRRLPVVMVTADEDAETVAAALAAGCDGYLTKPFSPGQCLATLRCALPRSRSSAPSGLPAHCEARQSAGECQRVSPCEHEVLARLAAGLPYKEIRDELGWKDAKLRKVIRRLFVKFDADNRTEAVNEWRGCRRCCGGAD